MASRTRVAVGDVKIIAVGLNYLDHAREVAMDLPDRPLLFGKWPSAIIGDGEAIVIPAGVEQVDYEAELAAVIGARVKNVSIENALEAVSGYACLNDVSARAIQLSDGQWTRGKSIDTFCPIGPRVIPPEEVGDPQTLRIACRVNNETVQEASTADMIFSVAQLVAFISQTITLDVGDIIATGTPPGVAMGRPDGRYLRDGDIVEVEIERVGLLTNSVVAGTPPSPEP